MNRPLRKRELFVILAVLFIFPGCSEKLGNKEEDKDDSKKSDAAAVQSQSAQASQNLPPRGTEKSPPSSHKELIRNTENVFSKEDKMT